LKQANKLCAPVWYLGYIASSDDRREGDPKDWRETWIITKHQR